METRVVRLRNFDDIAAEHERLYQEVLSGSVETKRADTLKDILKGVKTLRVDVPLKLYALMVQAKRSGVQAYPIALKEMIEVEGADLREG